MKKFSDFGILLPSKVFVGEKVKISKILNCEIVILGFRIEESKYPKNKSGKCLHLQIKIGEESRVVFTGSDVLINTILLVKECDIPFTATIIKEGEHFEFR